MTCTYGDAVDSNAIGVITIIFIDCTADLLLITTTADLTFHKTCSFDSREETSRHLFNGYHNARELIYSKDLVYSRVSFFTPKRVRRYHT